MVVAAIERNDWVYALRVGLVAWNNSRAQGKRRVWFNRR